MSTPPLDENATRSAHFARIRGTRAFGIGAGGGALLALIAGLAAGGLLPGILAGAVVLAIAFAIAFGLADHAAHGDFWTALAASLGMSYVGHTELAELTPMLAAGDRRHCEEWMTGRLPDGRPLSVGNYTFEVHHENGDEPDTWESFDYTLALIELAPAQGAYVRGLYLRPRNRLRLFGERSLPGARKERLHTESAVFDDRFDLYVDPDDDPSRALRSSSRPFIEQLAENPTKICFDYRAGSLAVFIEDHSDDAGRLVALLDAAKAIAFRIDAEIAESLAAGGVDAVRPA